MILTKRSLLRFFLGAEIIIFVGLYLFSPHGMQKIFTIKKEVAASALELKRVQDQVKELEHEVQEWKDNDFHKERVAREALYMAGQKEEVYFIK